LGADLSIERELNAMKIIICALSIIAIFFACGCNTDNDDSGDDDSASEWTDPATGLTWQGGSVDSVYTWEDAIAYCDGLENNGHSDWHLPTISELRTLVRGCSATETGGSCGVTDSCLIGCISEDKSTPGEPCDSSCSDLSCFSCEGGDGPTGGCYGPSELAGECGWYWSSSPVEETELGAAWFLDFDRGHISYCGTANACHGEYRARCVR
jgi:Protein of unknown function (DUF1566)